jgi:hypothetical protein
MECCIGDVVIIFQIEMSEFGNLWEEGCEAGVCVGCSVGTPCDFEFLEVRNDAGEVA